MVRSLLRRVVLSSAVRAPVRCEGSSKVHGAAASFEPPKAGPVHSTLATGMGALMWFWIFYRAKEDGAAVFLGQHPFEHHGDHGDGKH